MKRILLLVLALASLIMVSGCKSNHSGTYDYIPGKGWVPND